MPLTGRRCPCGSGRAFAECCGPILSGSRTAKTAEELMRSRYTANAVGDTAYLLKSRHPSTRPQSMNPRSGPDWLGLEILNTEQGRREDAWGTVEFRALYATAAGVKILHERSRFVREDGFWYYVDGDLILPTPSGEGKTGRNAPCPCGSGKKYKKCCLRRKT